MEIPLRGAEFVDCGSILGLRPNSSNLDDIRHI